MLSSASNGLAPPARALLNATFLHHCTLAGLDAAIADPAEVTAYADRPPVKRTLADSVLFNREPDALDRYARAFDTA